MKKVILISGRKRSGKDYIASLFEKILGDNVKKISFAEPVKKIIAETFNISLEDLDIYKNNTEGYGLEIKSYHNNQKSATIKYLDFRTVLQRLSTESCKSVFGDNVWAELGVKNAIKSDKQWILIPDFRFVSEFEEAIKESESNNFKVITINIFNNDLPQQDTHLSETELKNRNFKFDFVIDNTGYPNIEPQVINILEDITSYMCNII